MRMLGGGTVSYRLSPADESLYLANVTENAKFFTLQSGDVSVKANICVDCGAIELIGDVRKVQALIGRAKPV